MSTAEIEAYLWGQRAAREAFELLHNGEDVAGWMDEPATDDESRLMATLGPVRWTYWVRRGYAEWSAERFNGQ